MAERLSLGRQEKIKRKQDFKAVFDTGKRYSSSLISLIFAKQLTIQENQPARRLGIIASRKVGNAVQRNRLKRFIREVFRVHQHDFKVPVYIVVILKPAAREATRESMQAGFLELCKKAHLL